MGTLMWRWNFGLALADNRLRGARVDLAALERAVAGRAPERRTERWFRHLVGRMPAPDELRTLEAAPVPARLGLILASPAFQRC